MTPHDDIGLTMMLTSANYLKCNFHWQHNIVLKRRKMKVVLLHCYTSAGCLLYFSIAFRDVDCVADKFCSP